MNRRVALGGFAVIALAVVIGWWAMHGSGPPAAHRQTTVAGGPSTTGHGRARSAELDPARGGGDTVQVDDDPVGALVLEGQVVLGDANHPVEGATVVLQSNPPRTVVTEADGGFSFPRLVGRSYTLIARAASGVGGPVTVRLTGKTEPVILQLRPAGSVTVTVTGPTGAVAGAAVELRGVDRQTASTGADGTAKFPVVVPGGYEVLASAAKLARSVTSVRVGATGVTEVALVLRPGAPVAGRVIANGAPVAGARVVYVGASDWAVSGDDRLDAVVTGGDGGFRFDAMPAGSFRFVARHPPHATGSSPIVTLDGAREQTGVEIDLAPGAIVRGRVVDASLAPVASARVRVGVSSPAAFTGDGPRQAYTDDAGRFALSGLPRRALLAVAVHETGSSATVPVDATAGDVGELVLQLDNTGEIAGVVVDPAGEPLEGVQVSAGPDFARGDRNAMSQWRLRGFPQELTDSTGRFTLTGLAPGSYRVRANRARAAARGRGWAGEGMPAETGTTDLRIVLQPEGAVTGKVAFADGTPPAAFVVAVGFMTESFAGGDGSFTVDGLAPGTLRLGVRGPGFDSRSIEVVVESSKTADAGTITVAKGRTIAGTVIANGQPVAGATVYAGRQIFGSGSSGKAQQMGPFQRGTRDTTTDDEGRFTIAGFGPSDLAVVAEHLDVGRSKALRLVNGDPASSSLTLVLEPFGALAGKLVQGGNPAEGVVVTAQATSTPGALFTVASGPDGGYRFDKLAPERYKVSATLGMPMMGMKFYSKEAVVESGKTTAVDLAIEQGGVSLVVTPVAKAPARVGVASLTIVSGVIAATSARDLQLRLAAAGQGSSQWAVMINGGNTTFTDLVPGNYSACVVPFPAEVQGMAAMQYADRHGDTLAAFCKQVALTAQPAEQRVDVSVEIPAFVPDEP
jgi:hypothetical protein